MNNIPLFSGIKTQKLAHQLFGVYLHGGTSSDAENALLKSLLEALNTVEMDGETEIVKMDIEDETDEAIETHEMDKTETEYEIVSNDTEPID